MEYNSSKELLTIAQYGRNVQNLIEHAKGIEDDEYRQKFTEELIELMYRMSPTQKNAGDYKKKLWKHLFRIADYDIKVTPPDGEIPTPETNVLSPEVVTYPKGNRRFRHYGRNVQSMIENAVVMDDEEKKEGYTEVIGAYMKLAYKTWNRDHYVSDDVIKQDLFELSDGKLSLPAEAKIWDLAENSTKKIVNTNNTGITRGRSNNRGKQQRGSSNNRGSSNSRGPSNSRGGGRARTSGGGHRRRK